MNDEIYRVFRIFMDIKKEGRHNSGGAMPARVFIGAWNLCL
jgi:hypothetical protein